MSRIPENNRKKTIISFVVMGIVVVLLIAATILAWPLVKMLADESGRAQLKSYINSFGWGGVFITLGIQILQIIIAVIPGEPIEVLAGVLYGSWGGFFICMIGIIIGQALVFAAVKKFGRPLILPFFKEEELNKYRFLSNEKKLETTIFILYFIPGTPKDILAYVAGLTKIRLSTFLYLSVVARIPSVITSTIAGGNIASGNFGMSILIFVLVGILGIAGILYGDKFIDKMHRKKHH